MVENIKVRWLTDHEQTKVAPKTLSSQVYNEDGTLYKDIVNEALENKADKNYVTEQIVNISENALLKTEQELTEEEQAQVKTNLRAAGTDVSGKTVTPYTIEELDYGTDNHRIEETPLESVTAGEGAEVFNLYDGNNVASGAYSTAHGHHTVASGDYAMSEGRWTTASGIAAHSSGLLTYATGNYSTAEGTRNVASKNDAHAEGNDTTASGNASHSEGQTTTASNHYTHAEGWKTVASGIAAHAEGEGTLAKGRGQTAMGKWNIGDTSSLVIVGKGSSDTARSNAFKISNTGAGYFANDVYANDSKKLATEEYTDTKIAELINSAPETLDTLGEIAAAIQDNVDIVDALNEAIGNKANKTDVVQANWNQNDEAALDYIKNRTHWVEDDGETYHTIDEKFIPDTIASKDYVDSLAKKLNATLALGFYCIEEVTVIVNGVSTVYPANSNVEIVFADEDVFEIVPTSNNSILSLSAYPGALGTFYPWLEGVKQFSNILFNMNNEDMYTKWSQGNQGSYQVQFAQYANCIFWSDLPYISDVAKRTNYTLCSTTQLPLCYSTIPENTFKSFYLAFNVNSDPNWSNPLYKDSFANANWATQAFSYYGARVVGFPGHDSPSFNITLPKDCRGLMFDARNIECAGTFDAINTTNFGAKSGSWREAFGDCLTLRRLYIKNLKVNLNISWSPVDYDSIYYIVSAAANTSKITISVSSPTYNLLDQEVFDLATSKNIIIALLEGNYVEDKRLGAIANKADKSYVDEQTAAIATKKDKDLIVTHSQDSSYYATHSVEQIVEAVNNGQTVYFQKDTELLHLLEISSDYATFYIVYLNMDNKVQQKVVALSGNSIILEQDDTYDYVTNTKLSDYYNKTEVDTKIANLVDSAPETLNTLGELATALQDNVEVVEALDAAITNKANASDVLIKAEQTLTDAELTQVRSNLKFIGKDVAGQTFTIDGTEVTASANAEIFGDYTSNIAVGQWSIAEGSGTIAKGRASHAEGAMTQALADGTHTEGYQTKATGFWSHAEGELTVVSSYASHAEGSYCTLPDGTKRYGTASGYASHVEGGGSYATASCSHAEGLATTASGAQSHAEGRYTIAKGGAQHVEGIANIEDTEEKYIHIAGNGSFGAPSNAYTLDWEGNGWFSKDVYVGSTSGTNKDEGSKKLATEDFVTESLSTKVNIEEPRMSGALGLNHTGELGWAAVSLGFANTASGMYSFAEGMGTKATGDASHAEGTGNTASGSAAHAEGYGTEATKTGAHAEGAYTKATGFGSHAEGSYTIASGEGQHAEGKYNLEDSTAIHIVGNGTAESNRSNAHTLDWQGNAWFSGDVYVGSTSGLNKDDGSAKLATENYVDTKFTQGVTSVNGETGAVTINAASLGLTSVMKFHGVVDALPATSTAGSVVLMGNKEYVYDSNENWVELGDEGSHALKTISFTAGSGLTGGGTLEANRTIGHSNIITAGTATGGSGVLTPGSTFTVPSIAYDTNGHITSWATNTYTLPEQINIANVTQTLGDELILDCN